MLYVAIGILGATVMPHNLYLHSSIVQTRNYERTPDGLREAVRYASIDSTVALMFALFINAAILIVSAAAFDNSSEPVIDQEDATQPDDHAVPEQQSEAQPDIEEGPVHRPLIRAQLPRIEGQKEERRLPEFTIRQRGNGPFRGDQRMKSHRHGGNGQSGNNGNRSHGGARFSGQRPAGAPGRGQQGRGGGQPGFRSGQRQGGGRKRSR